MRIIGHLDMDAFFAAVEERDRPRFKGLPIAIGADPMDGKGRGVVSTANYLARKYGIHSAMPVSKAWQLSENAKKQGNPPVVFLFPNFEKYSKSSNNVMEILHKYSPVVEEASIDEAYFDLSFVKSYREAGTIARKIKKEVKEKEGLTCSVGIGPNKLISKISSGFKKPDGLTVIKENEVEVFLEDMNIREIPGIGPKTEIILRREKIKKIKDLRKLSEIDLELMMGKFGLDLYNKARGIDNAPLATEWEAKSIGEQETFLKDILDQKFIIERLKALCENVFKRFKESGLAPRQTENKKSDKEDDKNKMQHKKQFGAGFKNFKTIVITVRFAGFDTKTRSHTLKSPISDKNILEFEVLKLLMPFLDKRENPKLDKIRLIGVRIEKFE